MSVADIFRRFADALDDERCRQLLAVSPGAVKDLTDLLDGLGEYAERFGTFIRRRAFMVKYEMEVARNLTDELRRFADALEKRHDLVRMVDPGYRRLQFGVKAVSMFSSKMGIDLGLGNCEGVIVKEPVVEGRG